MAQKQKPLLGLMLGSLGVVFGDIGTSPLYALRVVFEGQHSGAPADKTVLGLLSMLLWTLTLVVAVKYIGFIMQASNKGEGGIMALVSLIAGGMLRRKKLLIGLGLVGVALFYGDSVLTPAVSVLSAVEGLQVLTPALHTVVIPLTLVILIGLFALQQYGTGVIGKLFGPIMLLWFMTIGAAGAWRVVQHPAALVALSPLTALRYVADQPLIAFLAMGAIVLAVTGAEALYADMGHFGRGAIGRAWFFVAFPALVLCYLGQGALVTQRAAVLANPFYFLFPAGLRLPMIILATAATLIASQAVIAGAFSLTRQAVQLRFLPHLLVRQTSERYRGQIYVPIVNFLLLTGVILLVIFFGSSSRLAGAYGVAVSGTLAVDSLLFMVVAHKFSRRSLGFVALYGIVFLGLDAILVAANVPKIAHGGWLPLAVAALVLIIMYCWRSGQRIVVAQRHKLEPPLQEFITEIQHKRYPLVRLPGQAVYIGHHAGLTPTALSTAVEELHELHEKVVIVYVETSQAAHVPAEERAAFDDLAYADNISQVTLTYGFHDSPNIPKALADIHHLSPELNFDPYKATYFISLTRVVIGRQRTLRRWEKGIYALLARNALSSSDYYRLPASRTLEVRTLITI